jgi:NAD(P)-dependent dehydrogenase (short-subunit alcohol dehydrogenase family)
VTDARSGGGPWRDPTIVVTGGTSGIGRQFAIHFATAGAKVIACGRNDMALLKLQTEPPTIEAVHAQMVVKQLVRAGSRSDIPDRLLRLQTGLLSATSAAATSRGSLALASTSWRQWSVCIAAI